MKKSFNSIYNALILNIIFIIVLGIIYPMSMTQIANFFFPYQSNGSINKFGSELIGLEWKLEKYFHGRPSFSNYDPFASGSSNVSPIDSLFIAKMKDNKQIPENLRTNSASGLDPHIDLDSAMYQVPRISQARKMPEEKIKKLIIKFKENPFLGFIGQERINVLKLNVELDKI